MQNKAKNLKLHFLGKIVALILKTQEFFTRFVFVNKPDTKGQFIIAAWHSNQCAIYGMKDIADRVNILISPSNDGQVIVHAAKAFGFKIIRGSHGRKGATQAVFKMLDALKAGDVVAVMIDGPKGPKHIVKPGVIELAKLSGIPIIPMSWYSPQKNFLKFNSWDEFRVPFGYCKIANIYGEPIYVPSDITEEEFEQKRLEVEEQLKLLQKKAIDNYSEYIKGAK